jgi:aminoacrylate hydrolase
LGATWGRHERYIDALFDLRLSLLEANARQFAVNSALMSYSPAWLAQNWSVIKAAERTAPVGEQAGRVVAERIAALRAFDREAELPKLHHPALVVGAVDDVIAPLFMQEYLVAAIPHAKLEQIQSGGHFFPVVQAEQYSALLLRWLTEHTAMDQ